MHRGSARRAFLLVLTSAVGETSVVFGAPAGCLVLRESLGFRRLAAAGSIAAGLIAIAL